MRRPIMEPTMEAPPPPYSETDSSPASNLILTPATSIGDQSSVRGSGHFGAVDDDRSHISPASAEEYFESRPVHIHPSGPPIIHSIHITSGTGPEDLPYPEPEQVFLSNDLTHQDWLTFVNYVLPDHTAGGRNDAADEEFKEESIDDQMHRLALGSDANSRTNFLHAGTRPDPPHQSPALPLSPEQLSAVEATVRFWNEGFFLPRGVHIKLIPSEPPSGPRPSTVRGERIPSGQRPMGWGAGRVGPNTTGVRIGPIVADNDGFRIGRNGVVADSRGFRIGRNGLVADSNGFRIGNMLVADHEGFRLGRFSATSRGVRLGGWGVGTRETPDEKPNPSSAPDIPDEKGGSNDQGQFTDETRKSFEPRHPHFASGYRYHYHYDHQHPHHHERGRGRGGDRGCGHGCGRGCGRWGGRYNHQRDHRKRRSSSSSSSSSFSSSSSSDSSSSREFEAAHTGFVGLKKELKELKKAHKLAKKQAKKERRAAKKIAKKERRRAKREGKRVVRESRRGHGNHDSREYHHSGPSKPSHHSEGLVTGVIRGADLGYQTPSNENPGQDMPGAYAPGYTGDPTTASRESNALREQARELEHEALVKETVAGGIRAAATSVDVPDKERVRKLEEASVVYEEAEAIRREVERLRAEASHLDRESAGSTSSYRKTQVQSTG